MFSPGSSDASDYALVNGRKRGNGQRVEQQEGSGNGVSASLVGLVRQPVVQGQDLSAYALADDLKSLIFVLVILD